MYMFKTYACTVDTWNTTVISQKSNRILMGAKKKQT